MGEGNGKAQGADLQGRHRRLVRRTALVSALTLISRILGYLREMLSAALFGDRSGIYDAFITAWRVPPFFKCANKSLSAFFFAAVPVPGACSCFWRLKTALHNSSNPFISSRGALLLNWFRILFVKTSIRRVHFNES